MRSGATLSIAAHVAAWLMVFAIGTRVPASDFARSEDERRARQAAEAPQLPDAGGGIDFIEMTMGQGTIAAGRYVLGDMSHWPLTLGYWPYLGHVVVVPDIDDDPTLREWWMIAGIAFVSSSAFWTAWVVLFVWLRSRDVRLAAGLA